MAENPSIDNDPVSLPVDESTVLRLSRMHELYLCMNFKSNINVCIGSITEISTVSNSTDIDNLNTRIFIVPKSSPNFAVLMAGNNLFLVITITSRISTIQSSMSQKSSACPIPQHVTILSCVLTITQLQNRKFNAPW